MTGQDEPEAPVDLDYLRGLWQTGPDPWRIETGFYERRKRELLLGCLPQERYGAVFEPGCAAGALTVELARRSESVLAADLSEVAVAAASDRVSMRSNVQVQQLVLPEQWPSGRSFDLIVLSEIGYFFSPTGWSQLCRQVAASLAPQATVLACHWRHAFAERTQPTSELHAELDAALGLGQQSRLEDRDFVIEVWTGDDRSVAQRQGLAD